LNRVAHPPPARDTDIEPVRDSHFRHSLCRNIPVQFHQSAACRVRAVPLGNPRRIFVSSQRRRAVQPALRLLLVGVVSLGAVSAAHFAAGLDFSSAALPQAAATPPAFVHLSAAGAAVVDGETLRLGGQVIRLEGVHAPARGQSCDALGECAAHAARRLAELVRGKQVACDLHGGDAAGRPFARCTAGGVDLNAVLATPSQASLSSASLSGASIPGAILAAR